MGSNVVTMTALGVSAGIEGEELPRKSFESSHNVVKAPKTRMSNCCRREARAKYFEPG